MLSWRVGRAECRERELGGVSTERSYIVSCGTLGSAAEEDAGDRTGEYQVSDLGDDGDGGKPRIDRGTEGSVALPGFDRDAESLEETGRQGSNRRLGVGGFPVDKLPGQ